MTASSVDFFPCRVQLMGLPQSNTTSSASASTSNRLGNPIVTIPRRSSLTKVRGVSRNLFGAPDPVEMNNLYKKEADRLRNYVFQRYNFDTKTSKPLNETVQRQRQLHQPTDTNNKQNIIRSKKQPTQFPTLIEKEYRQHEQRLQSEECNLNRSPSETTPFNVKSLNHANSRFKVMGSFCECSSSFCPAIERQKPYDRQSLLTESFNIRKNNVGLTRHGKQSNTEMINLKSNLSTHRNIEVFELPQAIHVQEESFNAVGKEITISTTEDNERRPLNDIKTSSSSSISCSDNCTTLSLKLVVTTQNIS